MITVLQEAMQEGSKSVKSTCQDICIKALNQIDANKKYFKKVLPVGWRVWRQRSFKKRQSFIKKSKVSDEQLLASLDPHTAPSCKWSRTTQRPLRTLRASKRQLHKTNKDISDLCSYRTLCRRLRRGRLGVGVGSPRVDDCDYCVKHDRMVRPEIHKSLKEWQLMGKSLHTKYWDQWELMVESNPKFKEPDFEPADSQTYLEKLSIYCNEWAKQQDHFDMFKDLSKSQQDEILKFGSRVHLALKGQPGWVDMVSSIGAHWLLRDNQDAEFQLSLKNPKPGWLYLHWDLAAWALV